MDDKDRFDRYMKLADFRLRRWDGRRNNEWKMSLAFWGLLIAAGNLLSSRVGICLFTIVLVLSVVIYVSLWSLPNLTKNDEDMDMAFYYSDHAERLLYSKETEKLLAEVIGYRHRPKRITVCEYLKKRRRQERRRVGWLNAWSPFCQTQL